MDEKTSASVSDDIPLDELKRSFSETKDPALRSAMLDAIANRGEGRTGRTGSLNGLVGPR